MMKPIPTNPADPRIKFPKHKERGPARHSFTYNDLAELLGCKVGTLYNARHRRELDPMDIESVVNYVAPRLGWVKP